MNAGGLGQRGHLSDALALTKTSPEKDSGQGRGLNQASVEKRFVLPLGRFQAIAFPSA